MPLASGRDKTHAMAAFAPRGTFTALVTPFSEDGSNVDWKAYERLVERQIAGGVTGLVPCGTTGETPTLTDAEQVELVQRTAILAKGRASVLAGTGSNSTKKTIEASKAALEAGADAVMIVMPYYNKPNQLGLRRHVEMVAAAIDAPIVLYNIPGRTGVELSVETLLEILQGAPNVVAVKDATGNVHSCQRLSSLGARVAILSGDDPLTLPMMSVGAQGVVSVTSNFYPAEVCGVVSAALEERWAEARRRHLDLLPVHAAMFIEPNPVPLKVALAARGHMTETVRPPLVGATETTRVRVIEAIDRYEAR